MATKLVIGFEIDGIHHWPNAPDKYREFRQPHRHLFKFICTKSVGESNNPARRQEELWELRQNTILALFRWVGGKDPNIFYANPIDFGSMSCEGLADLVKSFGFDTVFVGEEYWIGAIVSD